jgi:hypothetical protein
MFAVKNSMKRRLARSPRARMIEGKASSPARTSAGGSTISSIKNDRLFAHLKPLPSTSSFVRNAELTGKQTIAVFPDLPPVFTLALENSTNYPTSAPPASPS